MKNNKYAPYILGPLLLLLWGTIFYKIYKAAYPSEELFTTPNYSALPLSKQPTADSTYMLLLDYKDPFLGNSLFVDRNSNHTQHEAPTANRIRQNIPNNQRPVAPKITATPNIVPSKPFPKITYQGLQFSEGDTSALVKIDNQFYPTARKGQLLKEVQINEIYKDSIRVTFEDQTRTFSKLSR